MKENFGFQWHITDRCTGRCKHCYQSDFHSATEQPVSALKNIASHIMSQLDVPVSVNLTGGEPLLYNGLFELMNFLSAFSNLDELNLITSSYGMDSSTINELKKIDKLKSVKISLESHLSAVNDSIRGEGHFQKTVNNISALINAEIPVIIMTTLSSYNYTCVEGLCALAARLGVSGVIFERYVPLGRGEQFRSEVLNKSQWTEILRAVCRVGDLDAEENDLLAYKAFWIDIPVVATLAVAPVPALAPVPASVNGALCNLGSSSMALMPDGTVFPCRRLPVPVGRLPDCTTDQLLEKLSQYSPEVLQKEMKNVKCGSCQTEGCCGCRALSFALGSGMYGDDPLCVL